VCLAVVLKRCPGSRFEWRRNREPVVRAINLTSANPPPKNKPRRAMYSRKIFSLEAYSGDSSTLEKINDSSCIYLFARIHRN